MASCGAGAKVKVLGVLDGHDMEPELLCAWAKSAEFIIAADGAADRLFDLGVSPNIIVGDMDSLRGDPPGIEKVKDEDPTSTDCDKLLRWVRQHDFSNFTLTSIEGDLVDHMLATLSSCAAFRKTMRVALRRGMGWVFSGPIQINVDPGARVSLIPLTACSGVKLHGVQWRLDNAELDIGARVSVSNAATDGFVQASVGRGTAFLFAEYPREEMPFWD